MEDTTSRHSGRWIILVVIGLAVIGAALWYSGAFTHVTQTRPKLAIVTANKGPFWDLLARGANDAAKSSDAEISIIECNGDTTAQTNSIRELLGKGYQGVGVS